MIRHMACNRNLASKTTESGENLLKGVGEGNEWCLEVVCRTSSAFLLVHPARGAFETSQERYQQTAENVRRLTETRGFSFSISNR